MSTQVKRPTVKLLEDVESKLSRCLNDLDFARQIDGLPESNKEELWQMVLTLTEYSAALWRIRVLNTPE